MIGFGSGNSFYDALLNDVASPGNREKVSARGYAMGYLGGGILLAVNLLVIMQPGWFGLADSPLTSQIAFVSVGICGIVFFTAAVSPCAGSAGGGIGFASVRAGGSRRPAAGRNVRQLRHYPELWKFMLAYTGFS